MTRLVVALLSVFGVASPLAASPSIECASKKFTESVILGELACGLARSTGAEAAHLRDLGGTRVLFAALEKGEIDVYAEYTGTLLQEIFKSEAPADLDALDALLAARGLRRTQPFGFNNTYALGTTKKLARARGLSRISQLAEHPTLRLGFSNEFLDRGDGWPGLKAAYALPHEARGLDHDLAYRGLVGETLDVMDLYTTDAEIAYYDLVTLDDDRAYFPRYEALFLYRADLAQRAPEVARALHRLEGRVDAAKMVALNKAVKIDGEPDAAVAARFLDAELGLKLEAKTASRADRLLSTTADHLALVVISLLLAIALAVPLGVAAYKRPRAGGVILAVVGVLQTVPSLALLVFMIPLLGIGGPPAIAALFVYSLLPIVRNTHQGLTSIPRSLEDSARALGLDARARLRLVELPLALPAILAGVKTAAVINVGTATLGALIGAGGYGQPILTGIRLDDISLILEGAVPAALLALAAQGGFDLLERALVPRSLRKARA
jgi:osmoprotectant transport system permease protein